MTTELGGRSALRFLGAFFALGLFAESAIAMSEAGAPSAGQTSGFNPQRNAYFGDLHIHTRFSFDAYIFNVRVTPDDAYLYAKGEAIEHTVGKIIRLHDKPLDFAAVTDHAEYLGLLPQIGDEGGRFFGHPISPDIIVTDVKDMDPVSIGNSFFSSMDRYTEFSDPGIALDAWDRIKAAAERHYEPGRLTTFAAFEYTSGPGGQNLHRNVVFRGEAPEMPFSSLQSENPEDLWTWLDELRAQGVEGLAIPHNSNGSDGIMFDRVDFDGDALDAAYADLRMRNEPIVEMSQVKGTSETHPMLSPNDEWASFELFETRVGNPTPITKFAGSYVRDAYLAGLQMDMQRGFNPYRFGMIASTDTHNAGGPIDEQRYFGKLGAYDGVPEMRGILPPPRGVAETTINDITRNARWSASGLAGVWAEENTREAIYDAMRRKETFATSGPRLRVRFFAGYGFGDEISGDPDMISRAYRAGVPMGGDLVGDGGDAPSFLVWAQRDPSSAWLQRAQVVKGWVDANGTPREQVYDVACSDGMEPDPVTHRCADNGAKVNTETCAITNDKGATELRTVWRDPDFNPKERAFYYVRVLENPSCRWSTWEARRLGVPLNPRLPATIQERAWTSPIWYLPDAEM